MMDTAIQNVRESIVSPLGEGQPRPTRALLRRRMSLLCLTAAMVTASSNASADHSYATLLNPSVPVGDADNGISCWLQTDSIDASDCNFGNIVTHEMWYNMAPLVYGVPNYWVEVGVTGGYRADNGGCADHAVFWAQNVPSPPSPYNGYHEYYPNVSWYLTQEYEVVVQKAWGNCAWDVFFGGVYLGQSQTNCPGTGRSVMAGIETATVANYANGRTSNWKRLTSDGIWEDGWDAPGLYAPYPGMSIDWSGSGTYEYIIH